eukprot:403367232
MPSLLWFQPFFSNYILPYFPSAFQAFRPVDTFLSLITLWGMILSILIFLGRPSFLMNSFSFFTLWVIYLSHYSGGDRLMSFQWDILLLETGFVSIFFAPLWHTDLYDMTPSISIVRELIRWLVFRLMFASGIVKLLSKCKTWWGLTALHYHFETQPLPHALSWYAHQLPDFVLKEGVVLTYLVEIFLPFLFYSPFREHRIFASIANIIFMQGIILTGNYNFFNFLTIVLDLIILDDQFLFKYTPSWVFKALAIKGLFLYGFYKLFSLEKVLKGKINFTFEEMRQFMNNPEYLNYFYVYVVGFSLLVVTFDAIQWLSKNRDSIINAVSQAVNLTFKLLICYVIFLASAHIFFKGIQVDSKKISLFRHDVAEKIHTISSNFHIANSYGLFRTMTGVGGRPELIFSGSDDGKTWNEINLPYKPGDLSHMPQIVIPHQPRFDWQIWFSALGDFNMQDYYLIHFIYKLLNNDSHAKLLIKNDPFKGKAPKFVKIDLYHYHFSDYQDENVTFGLRKLVNNVNLLQRSLNSNTTSYFKNTTQEKYVPNNWWQREFQKQYMQPLNKEALEEYINGNKFGIYNKNPQTKIHFMQSQWPIIQVFVVITVLILCFNMTRKLKIIVLDKNTYEIAKEYVQKSQEENQQRKQKKNKQDNNVKDDKLKQE